MIQSVLKSIFFYIDTLYYIFQQLKAMGNNFAKQQILKLKQSVIPPKKQILELEQGIIAQIKTKPSLGDQNEQFEYFNNIKQLIEKRNELQVQYKIGLSKLAQLLFPLMLRIANSYKNIMLNISLQIERKEPIDQLRRVLESVRLLQETNTLLQNQLANLEQQISILKDKEILIVKNIQSFKDFNKDVKWLCQRTLITSNSSQQQYIRISISNDNFLIYVNVQFMRNLSATKSLRQINKLDKAEAKYIFHLLWFICLRMILSSPKGIDTQKYLEFRRGFTFIYSQIDDAEQLKLREEELVLLSMRVFEKYNSILALPFLSEQKLKNIEKNCSQQSCYLSEIDKTFQSVLHKPDYLNFLTKSPQTQESLIEQRFFRDKYQLDNTLMEDRIVENLIIIFYHFRNVSKEPYDLLMKAIVDMAIETKDTLNGKQSFYRNCYEHEHKEQKKQNLLTTLWKKISA